MTTLTFTLPWWAFPDLRLRPGRAGAALQLGGRHGRPGLRPLDTQPQGAETVNLDEDALIAAVDLVGRTGAREFQIGYLRDGVPPEQAGWYAQARYQGARIIADERPGPVEAAEDLARRLLEGGKCTSCGGVIALSGAGAFIFPDATLTDGTRWTEKDAAAAGQCRWKRLGNRWKAGCQQR